MWSWRLLLATGECRYADLIERVLFNGFMSGVSLRGDTYFYVNPLQVRAGHSGPEDGPGSTARRGWFDVACCPPNVMRTVSSLQHYFVTSTEGGVQLWQFAPSLISVEAANGHVSLAVETDYPLSGHVSVKVESAPSGTFEIALRVPGWAEGPIGAVEAAELSTGPEPLEPGRLWRTSRSWQRGDEIVMDIPLRTRVVHPHPRIDAVRGCVAFEYGPFVYCLEEVDAGGPERLEALRFSARDPLVPAATEIDREPLVGLSTIAKLAAVADQNKFPYDVEPWDDEPAASLEVRLVPYFVWGNRRPGETMRVWLPEI